jgi:hypothetical protein
MTRHLLERGRRRIAFAAAQLDPRTMQRLEGWRRTMVAAGLYTPTLEWLNPFAIVGEVGAWDTGALAAGLIIALFIYWGWDTTAAVNEESANPTEQPGRATVISTLILVATNAPEVAHIVKPEFHNGYTL